MSTAGGFGALGINVLEIEEAKRRARSGPLILLLRRCAALLITFVSTVTIARLVSPRDYGLANMSGVLLAFAGYFRDFGLTNAVLRKGTISEAELSLIFWFNILTTVLLSVILATLAPAAGLFFKEPVVVSIILVSLIGFAFSGATSQHRALLGRDFRFSTVALIETGASLLGFIVTFGLAWIWRNVWAIVLGNLIQLIAGSVLFVIASGWKPGRPRKSDELGHLLRFGANSSVYSISVFISNSLPSILIGHFLGSSVLGQYNRAQALYVIPNTNLIQPITQAVMPLMTRLRAHPLEYRDAYVGLVRKLCIFLLPLSVILTFAAVPLVEALLGDKWRLAGLVLMALAPAFAVMGFAYAVGDLFVTQDRSDELRRLGLWELLIRAGAIGIGVSYGAVGAAIGFTISTLIVAVGRVYVSGRSGPVSVADQVTAAIPGMPLAAGSAISCGALLALLPSVPDTALAAALITVGSVGAVLGGLSSARSRFGMIELANTFGFSRLRQRLRREH